MGKKVRRQGDPGGDKGEPSDSSEDNKDACPHTKKFKNRNQKTNKITITAVCKECNDSKSKSPAEEIPLEESNATDKSGEVDLFVCLFCASVGCGENGKGHALAHQKMPHSDCHDFAFHIKKGTIWCFLCQKEIQNNNLQNSMKALQKKIEVLSSKTNAPASDVKSPNQPTPFLTKEMCVSNRKQQLVKGLLNMGNTCFFNSVLQCLAQTPFLTEVLERLSGEGEKATIPGTDKLKPLSGVLSKVDDMKPPILAIPLRDLLKTLRNRENNNVERPETLLSCLGNRFEQFKGREQHDAHELLRHLLEGVRTDDLKRYQKVILEEHNLYGSNKGKEVTIETRQLIKRYSFSANDLALGPDIVFRGELISILECQECYNYSTRTENFLDLSLPVAEEKPLPPIRKKDPEYNIGPSKHQLKKEKKEKKKAKKIAARQASRNEEANSAANHVAGASNDESDPSDADVEDNAEPDNSLLENRNEVVESGYSSEKAQNGDSAESVSQAESGCAEGELSPSMEVEPEDSLPQTVVQGCANKEAEPPLPFAVDDAESENGASALDIVDLDISGSSTLPLIQEIPASPTPSPSPTSPTKEPYEDLFDFPLPPDLMSQECQRSDPLVKDCPETDPDCHMPKASPPDGGSGEPGAQSSLDVSDLQKRLSSLKSGENEVLDASAHPEKAGPSRDVAKESSNHSPWTKTLASKISINEGEWSVLSCLNQFTAIELMTNNNKVGCDNCTKKRGKEGKTVLTNSTKQLLISAPPAILIIQLKRFIADASRLKKMNRHVSFPMDLDVAPFCSIKCRDLPSIKPDQTEVRYSLYGVVEHSGQMGCGHYVAYVKVRPVLGARDPRWKFLAPGRPFLQESEEPEADQAASTECSVEEKWYKISDSHVTAVDEEGVKKSQAYLLFYERLV